MGIGEITEKLEKREQLIKQIKEQDKPMSDLQREIRKLEDQIEELEYELIDAENELEKEKASAKKRTEPLVEEFIKLEWDLGIRVSKDQLRLFDLDQYEKSKV